MLPFVCNVAFVNHLKQRKKLLEEELKKSGGLVNASGKPVSSSTPLVNEAGMPLQSKQSENVHITEDIDAVMKSRGKYTMKSASQPMLNVYDAKEGDTIEVCPEACMLVQEIIMWLEETTGSDIYLHRG